MTEAQLLDRIRELRGAGRSPKQIARSLSMSPAEVGPLVRRVAQESPSATDPAGTVVGCWVSPGWARGLSVEGHLDWPGQESDCPERAGMVCVLIARQRRAGKVSVCGYLVDVYCLGVKNALGPENVDDWALSSFVRTYFGAFDGESVPAPLQLAQHLALGAVVFAEQFGFRPHPDFRATTGHLGDWAEPADITFGENGKPLYVEGPWDDSDRIMNTLRRTVGDGNFHFIVGLR
jgi:hypothetical protein